MKQHPPAHQPSNRSRAAVAHAAACLLTFAAQQGRAASPDEAPALSLAPITGAMGETRFIIDTRLRSETVEQDGLVEEAEALTMRARLGFETGKAWQTALLVEGEFIEALDDDYRGDNAVASMTTYPVVPDPEARELNRLQLVNTSIPGTTVTVGRQRINLDDTRFVGNVAWRQNEQTFDAVRIVNRSIAPLAVDITYLNQVNRIFGIDSPQGRYHGDGYLANVGWQTPVGRLVGFGYLLDFDRITNIPAGLDPVRGSTDTYGLRFTGERPLSRVRIAYVGSFATQDSAGANPLDFSNDYYLAELTGIYRQFSIGARYGVLGGDGVAGFTTPLATLHRFQGWADKFLATPVNGIEDAYLSAGMTMKGLIGLDTFAALVTYHDYGSERLAIDYGHEVNIQLQARLGRFTGLLKFADYSAAATTPAAVTDTRRLWAQLEYVW